MGIVSSKTAKNTAVKPAPPAMFRAKVAATALAIAMADLRATCSRTDHRKTASDDSAAVFFAHANAEALYLTIETGLAHYWSRSR